MVVTNEDNTHKVDQVDQVPAKCPTVKHRIVVGRAGGGWQEYERLTGPASPEMTHPRNPSGDPMMIYFTSDYALHLARGRRA